MIDPVSLDQLRVFLAVCDTGSYSAAARKLRRAQSAVSRTVVALESSIKVSLFDRSGYIPELTSAGQSLMADARAAVARVDEFKMRAVAIANNLEPHLTLSAHFSISVEYLVPVLNEFRTKFPQTPLTLRTGSIERSWIMCLRRHQHHRCDAVSECRDRDTGGSAAAGAPIPCECIHGFGGGAGSSACRGVGADQLFRAATAHSTCRRWHSNTSRAWETGNVMSDRWWHLTNVHQKHQFLLAGFGWGIMPMNIIRKDIATGRLRKIEVAERTDWQPPIPIYIINRLDRPLGPASRWMVEAMLARGPLIDKASGAVMPQRRRSKPAR